MAASISVFYQYLEQTSPDLHGPEVCGGSVLRPLLIRSSINRLIAAGTASVMIHFQFYVVSSHISLSDRRVNGNT